MLKYLSSLVLAGLIAITSGCVVYGHDHVYRSWDHDSDWRPHHYQGDDRWHDERRDRRRHRN